MDTMTLAIAGVAALAILLIAVGIATSGGSGISDRLERYASPSRRRPEGRRVRPGRRRRADRPERRPSPASTRSSSSATSARTSPATSPGRTSSSSRREFLLIWAASIVGVPLGDAAALAVLPDARQPAVPAHRRARRLPAPALLAQPPQERAASARSTSSCPTRSRSSPTPCAPARRSCRPSSSSCASRGRRSRPSSAGSSARSTSACRSTRRSRTWSGASARTTSS